MVTGKRIARPVARLDRDAPDYDKLLAELSTPRWSIANGSVIQVDRKDAIRQRLGRSTDRVDSVVSALFISSAPTQLLRSAPLCTTAPSPADRP
jgi:hypothetical protein